MRNKDKLIAEIMAVCCALSTSTFFNMYGMAEPIFINFEEKKGANESNPLGENIFGILETHASMAVQHNVGCINFIINFSDNYSDCVINELLAMLAIKKESENGAFIKMSDLVTDGVANAPVEIYNLGQLFGDNNSLIKFTVCAQKTDKTDKITLSFNDSETTDLKKQTRFTDEFSIFRIGDKKPTIQYDTTEHKIILKIYIDLPDNLNLPDNLIGTVLNKYTSFSFGVDLKKEDILRI